MDEVGHATDGAVIGEDAGNTAGRELVLREEPRQRANAVHRSRDRHFEAIERPLFRRAATASRTKKKSLLAARPCMGTLTMPFGPSNVRLLPPA